MLLISGSFTTLADLPHALKKLSQTIDTITTLLYLPNLAFSLFQYGLLRNLFELSHSTFSSACFYEKQGPPPHNIFTQ